MKTIATWLTAGLIVAAAAAGCSVEVNGGDGGTTGGSGGTGGSTGGTAGTGGTGGGDDAGGTAGTGGSGGGADASSDGDGGTGIACTTNPNDPACTRCGYNKCMMDLCTCNAATTCRPPMVVFLECAARPGANFIDCASTFTINANPDGMGGALAANLAECMLDECIDTCEGRDATTRSAAERARLRALLSTH